jgi:hypothetical protein
VLDGERLSGLVSTTTRTADTRDSAVPKISFTETEGDAGANAYSTKIRIAELTR